MAKNKFTILLASALLCMGFYVSPFTVSAEEVETSVEISVETSVDVEDEEVVEGTESVENTASDEVVEGDGAIIPETEASKWFDETIKPFLVEYGAMIMAMVTAAFMVFKKLKAVVLLFAEALEKLKVANSRVEGTEEEVAQLRKENEEWREAFKEEMKGAIKDLSDTLKEVLGDKVDDIESVVHKILDVEKLAYISNAALVGDGTAKKISEVINK